MHVPLGEVVLVLVPETPGTVLPVTIGPREGAAIASVLAGIVPSRPLTHDLTLSLVRAAGRDVARVEIVGLRGGVFFAEIVLDDGTRVDARTSDAVALALRAGVPILCADRILAEAGEIDTEPAAGGDPLGEAAGAGAESELAQFRAFLESVEPEDFDDADS